MRQSPNSHKNVTPQIITDPKGVDTVVKALQLELLANLSWLDKSFNRAVLRTREDVNNGTIEFPACWIGQGLDEFNMIGNDNWGAYSFFYSNGSDSIVDYNQGSDILIERDLSLYFWFKPDSIDNTKGQGELIEQLKGEILTVIQNTNYSGGAKEVDITDIDDIPTSVFNEFTINTATTQSLHYPYAAIRFDLSAMFMYDLGC